MKKVLFLLFFIPLMFGCGSVPMSNDYGYVKGWALKDIPPSQVTTSGDMFYESKLSDGRTFSVGGYIGGDDSTYYYNSLMQDLGWTRKGDEFEGYYTTDVKRGHLYINIKRGVAVYFYPVDTFSVFKVTINPKEDN